MDGKYQEEYKEDEFNVVMSVTDWINSKSDLSHYKSGGESLREPMKHESDSLVLLMFIAGEQLNTAYGAIIADSL